MFTVHADDHELSALGIETRHMTTARKRAIAAAAYLREPVVIMANGRVRARILPDGSAVRPAGTVAPARREDCTRDRGTCFCTACRTERRGQRWGQR